MATSPDPNTNASNALASAAQPAPAQQDSSTQLAPGFMPLDADDLKAAGSNPNQPGASAGASFRVGTAGSSGASADGTTVAKLAPGFEQFVDEETHLANGLAARAAGKPLTTEQRDAVQMHDIHQRDKLASTPEKGTLAKAWDWVVKTPILDNVLPKGITTSDLVRGAAFEKMFNEPYIPGVNDFDTKAQQHLGDSPTKAAVKTFIAGTAKDTSDLGAASTTPLGIATIGAGVAAKAAPALGVLADEAKLLQGAGSAVYAGQGAHDVVHSDPNIHYEGITDRPETLGFSANPDEAQKLIGGLASVAGGVTGATEAGKPALDATMDHLKSLRQKTTGGGRSVEQLIYDAAPPTKGEAATYQKTVQSASDHVRQVMRENPQRLIHPGSH